MKNTFCKSIIYLGLSLVLLNIFSCSKSGSSANNNFTWTYGNTNYKANFNAAYLQSLSSNPIIVAGTGAALHTLAIGPRFTVSSLNVGTYNFNTSPNSMFYIEDQGNNLAAVTGTINITANAGNLLSGNFSATLSNSINVTGNFMNVPINQ